MITKSEVKVTAVSVRKELKSKADETSLRIKRQTILFTRQFPIVVHMEN